MVSQLLRGSPVKSNFDYIKNVYEVCLKSYHNNTTYGSWQDAQNAIQKGRKILQSDEEVDTYIAFYGAHHYYKLMEAFDALDMSKFCDQELEIFSYGCGAATDSCSLISYCQSKQIDLNLKTLTLIEPSQVALKRGVEYINQALSPEELKKINIRKVYKTLEDLEESDIDSKSETLKLHVFSNVLDIEEINLESLTSLIKKTQKGDNYFICINPKNPDSQKRINDFYQKMSNSFTSSDISTNDQSFKGRVWSMIKKDYDDNHSIHRYHRIFMTQIF